MLPIEYWPSRATLHPESYTRGASLRGVTGPHPEALPDMEVLIVDYSGFDATNDTERNDYSIPDSQAAGANMRASAAQLLAVLDARDADVKNLMANYEADGVSEQMRQLEHNWYQAGDEVRQIISMLIGALEDADQVAQSALNRASGAVHL